MSNLQPTYLITGASGQLGRLVVEEMLKVAAPAQIAVLVRSEKAAAGFKARGLDARLGDYTQPDALRSAFSGVTRALLISSNQLGQRAAQHRNVIDAARQAGVERLLYTSVLHAAGSVLGLAEEHRQTEALLEKSGVPYVILRNGWYTENYAGSIAPALEHGAFIGCADDGRISSASRADYAAAAAKALTSAHEAAGAVYELAGDQAFTLAEFAAEVSLQAGKPVVYRNLPQDGYKAALQQAGLPEPIAALLSNSDSGAAQGALFDDGHALSTLIGRGTTPYAQTIGVALHSLNCAATK